MFPQQRFLVCPGPKIPFLTNGYVSMLIISMQKFYINATKV